jgi:ribosomal protein L31
MNDLYEFGSKYAQTYKAKCSKCGNEIEVSTQQDLDPEYYTDVFVRCQCGGSAHFKLPVN